MRHRRLPAVLAAALPAALLAGCGAPSARDAESRTSTSARDAESRTSTSAAPPRIVLVDSIPYGDGMIEGHLRRVVVAHEGRQDTVPGVLVAERPVVGPDGAVYGIRAQEERAVGLFAYDVATRRVRTLPTPEGWWPSTVPRLAPDGRHVAYLAGAADGTGHAAVAALPSGRVIYRGPGAVLLETDAGVDEIAWPTAERFEVRVYLGGTTDGVQRVRGSVAPLAVQVDTVPVPRDAVPSPT
jgi:hypothetical protein